MYAVGLDEFTVVQLAAKRAACGVSRARQSHCSFAGGTGSSAIRPKPASVQLMMPPSGSYGQGRGGGAAVVPIVAARNAEGSRIWSAKWSASAGLVREGVATIGASS